MLPDKVVCVLRPISFFRFVPWPTFNGAAGWRAEAAVDLLGGRIPDPIPGIRQDAKKGAKKHNVLHAGLEIGRADGTVEDRVRGSSRGLKSFEGVAGDWEGGERGECRECEVEVWEAGTGWTCGQLVVGFE